MATTIATATTAITIGIILAGTTISIITKDAIMVSEFGWSVATVAPATTVIGEAANCSVFFLPLRARAKNVKLCSAAYGPRNCF